MALLLLEGFEFSQTWNAANYGHNWAVFGGNGTTASGRNGRGKTTNNSTVDQTVSLGTPATVIVGLAYKFNTDATETMLLFKDAVAGTIHGSIKREASTGKIHAYRGTSTLLGSSASGVYLSGVWNYIEVKWTVDDTVGVVVVRVNGVEVLNLTSQDTKNSTNAYCACIGVSCDVSQHTFDDMYICDTSGSVNNDFLGDCKVVEVVPTGAGNYTQWTPSAGSNWQNVDDSNPNGDTDYNSDSTIGNKDTYDCAALGVTGTVYGIQHVAQMRKDDAGSRSVRLIERVSATDYNGSDIALSDSYVSYARLFETNPNTGVLWTVSGVDAAEPGQETRS